MQDFAGTEDGRGRRWRERRTLASARTGKAGAGTGPPPGVVKNGAEIAPEAARLRE
jgi:hypothetical protein